MSQADSAEKVYDMIRMLDAEGYPAAFLETDEFRMEFRNASMEDGKVKSDVLIKRKKT